MQEPLRAAQGPQEQPVVTDLAEVLGYIAPLPASHIERWTKATDHLALEKELVLELPATRAGRPVSPLTRGSINHRCLEACATAGNFDLGLIAKEFPDVMALGPDERERFLGQRRLDSALSEQRDHLARQVRAAYAAGRQEYVKILLNQEDPAAVGRVMTYYDYLNRSRLERIASINTTLDELAAVKAEHEAESGRLGSYATRPLSINVTLKRAAPTAAIWSPGSRAQISSKDQQLARLMADEKDLQNLIAALSRALEDIPPDIEGKPFSSLKGKLGWPAKGPFLANFGSKRNVRVAHLAGGEDRVTGRSAGEGYRPGTCRLCRMAARLWFAHDHRPR